MNEYMDFFLLLAALIYFWTVMFERFDWSCSALAGFILIGCAGAALKPADQHQFFDVWRTIGFTGLLLGRSWLIFKEWNNDKSDHGTRRS